MCRECSGCSEKCFAEWSAVQVAAVAPLKEPEEKWLPALEAAVNRQIRLALPVSTLEVDGSDAEALAAVAARKESAGLRRKLQLC